MAFLLLRLHHSTSVNLGAGTPDTLGKALLIFGAVIDFITAGTLSYYLNRARTGIKQTDKIIDRLIIYTVNNGILTSVFDIIALILVFRFPEDLYSLAVSQVIGKLYSNSLMATFNSRSPQSLSPAPSTSLDFTSPTVSAFGAASNPPFASDGAKVDTGIDTPRSIRRKQGEKTPHGLSEMDIEGEVV